MNVRLDEIMDELKKSGKKIDNLTGLLEKANDRADKALLESKMHQKENIELKKMNATLQQRLNLMNSMAFGPSKSHIEEHHFEVLKVKHADGRIESMYLPMKDDARADIYNEIVPGTSITANMLSYLMFNRFQMSTPAYREVKNRLSDRNWNTSPQNLLNWADKGAMQLNKLIPALKKIALQDGTNPLLLYMCLDNELMDIEHLCCLAQARAKFKYAYDQGSLQSRIFFELIAELYGMEDTYRRRNSKETTEIIDKIKTELYDLLGKSR